MTRLVWAVSAQRDLKAIRDYISKDSKVNARRFVQRIKYSAQSLVLLPESGSLLGEAGFSLLREIYVGSYRVIYLFDGHETVSIVRVVHGARLLPDAIPHSDSDGLQPDTSE